MEKKGKLALPEMQHRAALWKNTEAKWLISGIISAIWFGCVITEAAYSQLTRLMDPRAAGDRGLAVTLRRAPPYASYYANWEFKGLFIVMGLSVMDEVLSSWDCFESTIYPL